MRGILKSGVVKAVFQPTPDYAKEIGELTRQNLVYRDVFLPLVNESLPYVTIICRKNRISVVLDKKLKVWKSIIYG